MMDKVYIETMDGVHNKIFTTNMGIEQELSEYFSFHVPNYQFMPAYKNGWDGKIRLYGKKNILYAGLWQEVKNFCHKNGYEFVDNRESHEKVSLEDLKDFISTLGLPEKFEIRDYQYNAILKAINNRRMVVESSVASGKSLIIYILCRWYQGKSLVIVPTVTLVHQLAKNFQEYGCNIPIHKIHYGQEKDTPNEIVISTWQSLITVSKGWFQKYNHVIVDEAHLAQSKSMRHVLESCTMAQDRIGLTGSMKDTEAHKMVIEGLLGPTETVSRARELIDRGYLAKLQINCIILEHDRRKFDSYPDEIKHITTAPERNAFIIKLAKSLKGNTLVLFNFEDQGLMLRKLAEDKIDLPIFYIQGKVKGKEREDIRLKIQDMNESILIASEKTTGIGVDIPSMDNIILASPSKSRGKLIQAIGRILRKNGKTARAYDLADDFGGNYTMNHFKKRIQIYRQENHSYNIKKIGGMI